MITAMSVITSAHFPLAFMSAQRGLGTPVAGIGGGARDRGDQPPGGVEDFQVPVALERVAGVAVGGEPFQILGVAHFARAGCGLSMVFPAGVAVLAFKSVPLLSWCWWWDCFAEAASAGGPRRFLYFREACRFTSVMPVIAGQHGVGEPRPP